MFKIVCAREAGGMDELREIALDEKRRGNYVEWVTYEKIRITDETHAKAAIRRGNIIKTRKILYGEYWGKI